MLLTEVNQDLFEEWSKLSKLGLMGHVREYGMGELLSFFDKTGFKVLDRGYSGLVSNISAPKAFVAMVQKIIPPLRNDLFFVLSKK